MRRTVAEQAAEWRCSPDAVRSLIERGDLPAVKIAERWLIDPADAAQYEAEQRSTAAVGKRTRRPRRHAS